MPVRVAAQKSTARIDTVCEAGLRPTFLFSPELRHVLAQGTGQTRATRHRKMKRAIVHPELRSAAVGRSCETVLGVVSHGTGKCPSPVFPRVHLDPNTSAVRSTGYCSGMIMRLRGSVCTRGVLQMLATSNAMYPAWFLRGRGWGTSSAPLPQWKRHPMPGGGAPVVRELPSWTVNNGE